MVDSRERNRKRHYSGVKPLMWTDIPLYGIKKVAAQPQQNPNATGKVTELFLIKGVKGTMCHFLHCFHFLRD